MWAKAGKCVGKYNSEGASHRWDALTAWADRVGGQLQGKRYNLTCPVFAITTYVMIKTSNANLVDAPMGSKELLLYLAPVAVLAVTIQGCVASGCLA